ncbi:MAG: type III-A CRISPR-associated protein Cas10/Csm1, partial [Deltaproteobacteria bacterium]|nr:type III-A CRISPR-associated protein Cas10/Csm1 [Deltaproteobacteria bacterium]
GAVAAYLFRYHERRAELQDPNAIKNNDEPKFQFLTGDLSGIQSTLFTLERQGVKGVNKILRARSFVLGAVAEAAALRILEAFNLPRCCLIQQAGGRFLILLPEIQSNEAILSDLQNSFDLWLLEHYTGTLSINLSLSSSFPGKDFQAGSFQKIFLELGQRIDDAKQRPLASCSQGVIPRKFPLNRSCDACGIRPAEIKKHEDIGETCRCAICQAEVELGGLLPRAEAIVWGKDFQAKLPSFNVLGIDLYLLRDGNVDMLSKYYDKILSIHNIQLKNTFSHWVPWPLAGYVPRFLDDADIRDSRYSGIDEPGSTSVPGMVKSFAHIGADALEIAQEGGFRGKPFLALLKADVDYLGFVFSHGLRRIESKRDRFTLSRLAQLSRMIDLYFTGYLQGVIRREFPSTYTVYAGGDDLLLIGPWRQSLRLAERIADTFADYTGCNPHITLSAGLSLFHSNYPVNRAVGEAERFLELAKDSGRNRICALMERPLTWKRYRERLDDAQWVHEQMNKKDPVSTGFVYKIMELAEDAQAVARGRVDRAGWRARLAYHLARNIRGKTENKKQRITEWLEHLGLDDMLKLTELHPHLYDWRLPAIVALYRNRKY